MIQTQWPAWGPKHLMWRIDPISQTETFSRCRVFSTVLQFLLRTDIKTRVSWILNSSLTIVQSSCWKVLWRRWQSDCLPEYSYYEVTVWCVVTVMSAHIFTGGNKSNFGVYCSSTECEDSKYLSFTPFLFAYFVFAFRCPWLSFSVLCTLNTV